MKKVKRAATLLIMLTLVGSMLAACGGNAKSTGGNKESNTSGGTSAQATTEPNESERDLVLGFSQIGMESGWRGAETDSIKETFAAGSGFELKFSDGQQKQENQIKAIRTFIAQKVDAIALAPIVESGWETVLQEAKDAGIPVFLLDRNITPGNEHLYTSFIGSDFVLEGENAAKWVIDEFGSGAEVNIVELQGTVGASAANDRKKGFEQAIANESGYKIIKSQTAEFTLAKGKEVMEAFLKADGDNIDVLYAHNDDMALGAIQAIEEYGLKPGTDIKVVSIDGIKAAFEAIRDGKLNVTVECNPLLGPQLKQAILDVKAGKTVEKWIKSEEDVFYGQKAIDALPNRKY